MKRRNGLTIIELLLSLALISIIILGGTNLLTFGIKSSTKTMDEFNVQSNVRLVSQSINNIIRDSSAVFMLDKEPPNESENLEIYFTEGWNYIMVNEDKNKLIEWVWDGSKHNKRIIIDSLPNVNYDLTYHKESSPDEDRLLEFDLNIDVDGNPRTIKSELEAINSLQVIDRSYGGVANTLAYRSDSRLTDVGVAQAAVSFVIDKSGSMNEKDLDIGGGKKDTRINVLKREATKMIETLSEYENIYLSVSPFSATANSDLGDNLNKALNLKSNKNVFISDDDSIIESMEATGGTNTGDGMRRGLSSIVNFNNEIKNENKTTKNFMIILVDGDSTFATVTERVNNRIKDGEYRSPTRERRDNIILNSGTPNERIYNYYDTTNRYVFFLGRRYTHHYKYNGENHYTYYTKLGENVGDFSGTHSTSGNPYYGLNENDYKSYGKVIGNGTTLDIRGKEYVSIIGNMIKDYKNTREDGIETFIIGFSNEPSLDGLQQIADATESTHGTHGKKYKYFKADTAQALEAVLDEIKFQISEALWHIGGPN